MHDEMNKTKYINFRVTEEQRAIIERNARDSNLKVSKYLRILGMRGIVIEKSKGVITAARARLVESNEQSKAS